MAAAVYPRPTTIQNLGLADIAAHTERVKVVRSNGRES